jgi:2-ketocyclohexanecarboxyl-CoA hydrolase
LRKVREAAADGFPATGGVPEGVDAPCAAILFGRIVEPRFATPERAAMAYQDILYDKRDGIATITINRPRVLNAFRAETVEEMLEAMRDAEDDRTIGVIVLAGAGERAFCSGGDNSARAAGGTSANSTGRGGYGGRGLVGLPIEELHDAIRNSRKPVIAKVQGYAIGGGNVLATVCDLTIASEKAVFGQVGPRVGSVDPGWGTAYLARLVGDKRAREIWFLCRRYTAAEAYEMGLVNKVVPAAELDAEVESWCREILALSPTAIAIAKRSFNVDSENIKGIGALGLEALALYYNTEEAKEGTNAFLEKRRPDFRKKTR